MQDFLNWMEKENEKEPRYKAVVRLSDIRDTMSIKKKKAIVDDALRIYPDLGEGYIELFLIEKGYYRKLLFIDKAISIGKRLLEKYDSDFENYYGIYELRAYIIALDIKAEFLLENGIREEAIALYEEIIDLDSSDHLGVRFKIIPEYIMENNDDSANNIYDIYILDDCVEMDFNKALLEYRQNRMNEAKAYLKKAMDINKYVVKAICHDREYDKILKISDGDYTKGSILEAQSYLLQARKAWRKTDGAISWLLARLDKKKEKEIN